ncbi:MAG: hypothetical protein GY946_05270 [bacterium]|nr:hypothetical protein [bacterium]
MTVSGFGMQLHAAVVVDGRDRKRLERICRYLLRPAFAHDAVRALPDGRVRILYRQPSRSGKTFADVSRDVFLARLCASIPPPGVRMVRYYGILASRHRLRSAVVPTLHAPKVVPKQLGLFLSGALASNAGPRGPSPLCLLRSRTLSCGLGLDRVRDRALLGGSGEPDRL